jgi:hypothetical protein
VKKLRQERVTLKVNFGGLLSTPVEGATERRAINGRKSKGLNLQLTVNDGFMRKRS